MRVCCVLFFAGALAVAGCKPEKREAPDMAVRVAQDAPVAAAPMMAEAVEEAVAPETVGEALEGMVTINGRPAADAEFYVYLQSASWCPPCRAEMPKIVAAYPEMRKRGVEVVLIGYDEDLPSTQRFLEEFGAG